VLLQQTSIRSAFGADIGYLKAVGQDALASLVGHFINQPAQRIVVGNGAAELIKIISGHLCNQMIIPMPSFNEYANAAHDGKVTGFAIKPPSFQLDVE